MTRVRRPRSIAALIVLGCLILTGCGGGGGSSDDSGDGADAAQTTDLPKTDGDDGASDDSSSGSDDAGASNGSNDAEDTESDAATPKPVSRAENSGSESGGAPVPTGNGAPNGNDSESQQSGASDANDSAVGSNSDENNTGEKDSGAGESESASGSDGAEPQAWYARFLADSPIWSDTGVVSAQLVNASARDARDVPVTFGQVFRAGDVPRMRTLNATVAGERVALQVDRKASWPDGSLRHAVITARIPTLAAGSRAMLTLAAADSSTASQPIGLDDVLGTAFDAEIDITMNGRSYRLSARTLLENAQQTGGCEAWGRRCKRWLSGPLASEWIVGAPLKPANGAPAPHLAGYFNVRAYAGTDGVVDRVRVDSVIENDWAYVEQPGNRTYDVTLRVGQHTDRRAKLTHYRQARWHEVLWWRQDPGVYVRANGAYIQASKAVSRYAEIAPTEDFLSRLPAAYPPMSHGAQTAHMGNTGAQPAIGPLPRWSATYLLSTDARAYRWMRANDDAVGGYAFHYRDADTGRPLEITRHPYVTRAAISYARTTPGGSKFRADLLPACEVDCHSPLVFDIAHHPSIGYLTYLVSGDYYYLEELQFTASFVELWANPKYRQYAKGVLRHAQGQVRGQAWALRSIADAAFATPDDDPLKAYFRGLIQHILADYNAYYVDQPAKHPMHVLDDYGAVIYGLNGEARVGVGPWQADFFTWSVGHAAEQGFEGARSLLRWLSVFQIGRMTRWKDAPESGYCWVEASAYSLEIRAAQHARFYADLDTAYRASFPKLNGLTCDGQPMTNRRATAVHTYRRGEMHGYADSATGFPSNLQIGLAMAVESGIDRADEAWRIFSRRSVTPDYRDYPNFAVIPR